MRLAAFLREEHKDFEGLHVVGECGKCKLLFTTASRMNCPLYVAAGRKKDFGCVHFEEKTIIIRENRIEKRQT